MSDEIKHWRADIQDRMADVGFSAELGPDTYFSYIWDHGYERVETGIDGLGTSSYAGSYHHGGYCTNGRDDGPGICIYCGRTLHE